MLPRLPRRAHGDEPEAPLPSVSNQPPPQRIRHGVAGGRRRLHREGGASAVELALIFPLVSLFLFGIIEFGVAFLQVQSIRTGVREGGRAAAVGASVSTTRQKTVDSSVGAIPASQAGNVQVSSNQNGLCTAQNIGSDVTVTYETKNLPGGGIIIRIPLITQMVLKPVITANFRCEV
jgi:Flp pilus assembly protein TadG